MTTTEKVQGDRLLRTMVTRLCELDATGSVTDYDDMCEAVSGRLELLGADPDFEGGFNGNSMDGIVVEIDDEDVYIWAL